MLRLACQSLVGWRDTDAHPWRHLHLRGTSFVSRISMHLHEFSYRHVNCPIIPMLVYYPDCIRRFPAESLGLSFPAAYLPHPPQNSHTMPEGSTPYSCCAWSGET